MKINLYSSKSKTAKKVDLPAVFMAKENESLLAQALHVYKNRAHPGTAKAQTRSEVTLTKSKWYRQKGTGNARHGAKSAHIFVGGGVAHGPTGEKKTLTLPKKMRAQAQKIALGIKAKSGDVVAADGIKDAKKTKDIQSLIKNILEGEKAKKNTKILFLVSENAHDNQRLFKNIENIKVMPFKSANAHATYLSRKIVIDNDVFSKPKPKAKAKKETK